MSRNQRRNKRNKQGGTQNANRNATRDNAENQSAAAVHHRSSTETKLSLKTTELIAYAGAVLAVIMTALAVDGDGQGSNDPFGAELAIRYIAYLSIGYLLARGLAKSGSHENHIEHNTDIDDDTARTGVVRDDEARDDDDDEPIRDDDERIDDDEPIRDDDERIGDDDIVETAAVPSDRVQRPAAEDVESKP